MFLDNVVIVAGTTEGGAMDTRKRGTIEIEDRTTTRGAQGATIMKASETPNEGVITSYAQAPARTVTAGGVTYAYRELGPQGGIPVIFLVHLAATLDNWTRASSTPSRRTTTSSLSTTAASAPPQAGCPTPSRRWPTTHTPSSRPSGSARSTSSPSPSAASSPRHSS